jgi:hypothetical protein
MMGDLATRKSPRTLARILKEARHGRIAVPAPTGSSIESSKKPVAALSIKPVRNRVTES